MIIKLLMIFLINVITFGGGAIYIPIYESFYVSMFGITDVEGYYSIVSISNLVPGVTGGKLASYALFLSDGLVGFFLAMLVFVVPFVFVVVFCLKFMDKLKQSALYQRVIKMIKPVIVGVLLAVCFDFFKIAFLSINFVGFVLFTLSCLVLMLRFKVNIMVLILVALLLGVLQIG